MPLKVMALVNKNMQAQKHVACVQPSRISSSVFRRRKKYETSARRLKNMPPTTFTRAG